MKFVTISDKDDRNLLAFDLKDILDALGDRPAGWTWEVQDLECTGHSADELHHIGDTQRRIDDDRLLELVSDLLQTINGTFIGRAKSEEPSVVIRAVDSSYFDVQSDDVALLRRLQDRFVQVSEIDDWPEP